jgi:type IV secretory pathway VirB2 component (pilin)
MQGALPGATGWIVAVATGPLVTGLAMLAVMGFGLTALTGTMPKAQVLRVLLGLALLFAAPLIAREILFGPGNRGPWQDQSAIQADTYGRLSAPQPICWSCR